MRYNDSSGIVAQLVRALPCHGRGRGFESRRFRHFLWENKVRRGLFFGCIMLNLYAVYKLKMDFTEVDLRTSGVN